MSIETSIIIRAKNEERWLGVTLKKLFERTYFISKRCRSPKITFDF